MYLNGEASSLLNDGHIISSFVRLASKMTQQDPMPTSLISLPPRQAIK